MARTSGADMSRYRAGTSYGHRIERQGPDDYRLHWTYDRYFPGSRLRHPQSDSYDGDHRSAVRFSRKWGCPMPPEPNDG